MTVKTHFYASHFKFIVAILWQSKDDIFRASNIYIFFITDHYERNQQACKGLGIQKRQKRSKSRWRIAHGIVARSLWRL
jgi:hypothetical protein